ncbi:unnamed protein product [Moneuplotes crassus]|uniref:NADP-dependent oxidoreductase domain-containing protein n=1 Tax=Euplotes crassus TaxID=5936 RepID=A0AAD1UDM1_EUPCR|nr:unnamed protein product [Moneuplotes crassus]
MILSRVTQNGACKRLLIQNPMRYKRTFNPMKSIQQELKINESMLISKQEFEEVEATGVPFLLHNKQLMKNNPNNPNAGESFLENIKVYEETLDDTSKKFYLTKIANKGKCTARGTKFYKDRTVKIRPENFRKTVDGQSLSLLSIDTSGVDKSHYGDFTLYAMLKLAAQKGVCNTFKTSNHCRNGRSERILGRVIDTLIKKYGYSREEFMLITESGKLYEDDISNTPSLLTIENLISNRQMHYTDVVSMSNYCIHPAYLKIQLENTLQNMMVSTMDVNLLHYPLENIACEHNKKETSYRVQKAFEFYEEMILAGKLRSYGMTCRQGATPQITEQGMEHLKQKYPNITEGINKIAKAELILDLQEVTALAEAVGGKNHGFRYVVTRLSKDEHHPLITRYIKLKKGSPDMSYYDDEFFKNIDVVSMAEYCKMNKINLIGQNNRHSKNDSISKELNLSHRDQQKAFNLHKNITSVVPFTKSCVSITHDFIDFATFQFFIQKYNAPLRHSRYAKAKFNQIEFETYFSPEEIKKMEERGKNMTEEEWLKELEKAEQASKMT